MANDDPDLAALACDIVDTSLYVTLGTAGADGRPWVSPVYFALDGYDTFLWVSDPAARHSCNLAERPDVSLVVFDSRAPIGNGTGVYMTGRAGLVPDAEVEHGIRVFSRTSQAHGARPWRPADVRGLAKHRLYRATVSEHWALDARDRRVPVTFPAT